MYLREENVRLCALEPDDVELIMSIENDSESWIFSGVSAPVSHNALVQYALDYDADPLKTGQLRLTIKIDGTQNPVGLIDLFEIDFINSHAFVGIYVIKQFRNQGIAGRALKALAPYTHEVLNLNSLCAKVCTSNDISLNLFEKAGYVKKGVLSDWIRCSDRSYSVALMQLML